MDVIPRVFGHGMVGEAPGVRFAEREGEDVFEAQSDDPGGVAEGFHLVDFERQPEGQGRDLDNGAGREDGDAADPDRFCERAAMAQQQRNGEQGGQLDAG